MHNVQRADQTIQQLWWREQDVENSSNNSPQYFYINSYISIAESIGHWSLLTCWNSEGFASAETWSSWCFGPHPGSGTARTSVWMPGDPAAPTCTKWCRHGRHWALSNPKKNKQKVTINIIITIILNWKKKIVASVLALGKKQLTTRV